MNPEDALSEFELRIRPNRSWIRFDWQGIWEYRDLLVLLVRRDFVSKYQQTVLGPAWFIIQPLITTTVFTLIFSRAAKISTDGLPPMLFYLCGSLGWSYFANTFGGTSTTLISNAGLFGKVYFPRMVVPLSAVISNLFTFGIQLLTFLVFWFYYKFCTTAGIQIRWEVVLLPLFLLHIAALSLGVGLWMSALTAKYRDFVQLSGFILQIWMFATPVIFPLSVIPLRWRWLVILNPMTMPVEALKYIFLGQGYCNAPFYLISALITFIVLVSGQMMFQKVERTFVDSV